MKVLVASAFALALALAPTASAARTYWIGYTGSPIGAFCGGILQPGDCPSVADASVQLGPFRASHAEIAIQDDSGRAIGATYTFLTFEGEELSNGTFCEHAPPMHVPDGARYLIVDLDTPLTPQHCGLMSSAVSGYVMVKLR